MPSRAMGSVETVCHLTPHTSHLTPHTTTTPTRSQAASLRQQSQTPAPPTPQGLTHSLLLFSSSYLATCLFIYIYIYIYIYMYIGKHIFFLSARVPSTGGQGHSTGRVTHPNGPDTSPLLMVQTTVLIVSCSNLQSDWEHIYCCKSLRGYSDREPGDQADQSSLVPIRIST